MKRYTTEGERGEAILAKIPDHFDLVNLHLISRATDDQEACYALEFAAFGKTMTYLLEASDLSEPGLRRFIELLAEEAREHLWAAKWRQRGRELEDDDHDGWIQLQKEQDRDWLATFGTPR